MIIKCALQGVADGRLAAYYDTSGPAEQAAYLQQELGLSAEQAK